MVRAGVSVVALDTSWDTGVCLKPLAVRLNALCVASQWQSRPLVRNKKVLQSQKNVHCKLPTSSCTHGASTVSARHAAANNMPATST